MRKNFWLLSFLFLVFPVSSNYSLHSFGFGGGGSEGSDSSSYSFSGVLGDVSETSLSGSSYDALPGLIFTYEVNTPPAPTLTNTGSDYNKLKITLDTGGNPSDTEYAIAISDDNFSTTNYVQSNNTVGATLGSEDWQTYTAWGGASGEFIVDLETDTTYTVKVKARQGNFTQGPWGPTAQTATSALTLSFDIDISSTDSESAAPYTLDLSALSAGSVTTSSNKLWFDLTTNAANGGTIYIYGTNSGLYSASTGHTISTVTGNLTSVNEGFGLQYASVSESSGGPLAVVSPYDGTSNTVGIIETSPQPIFNSSSTAISGGRASIVTKAKITQLTPSASDYSETLTAIAASLF